LTGPTGCGKSTTLYTFLADLNKSERRIVTIEDPVENKLAGVAQIPVQHEIGLTFAAGLRAILRADPNVVMVGEMRDLETAQIAIRAALTGHLVFSTLHTNDAVGGITRLVDMGLEPFLVNDAVRAFIAQRLVRKLCPECRVPAPISDAELKAIGFPLDKADRIMRPNGCPACRNSGYHGRLAIYELCELTQPLQDAVLSQKEPFVLREIAASQGMRSLRQYGFDKVAEGATSVDEVLRVTAEDAA
ncbi:MAG: type II/IV secretion system protein, partial [Cupriavidus sp.]